MHVLEDKMLLLYNMVIKVNSVYVCMFKYYMLLRKKQLLTCHWYAGKYRR